MPVVGFGFKKIIAEKITSLKPKTVINTDLNIKNVRKVDSKLFSQTIIVFDFLFNVLYKHNNENVAIIQLEGEVLYTSEEKIITKILEDWKNKKISNEIRPIIYNTILDRCNFKALQLEHELGLPFHLPFPKLKLKK